MKDPIMPSWRVEISNTSDQTAIFDLLDMSGPLNDWQSLDPNAFQPNRGHFINQFSRVIPSEQPSWFLNDLDIDEAKIGSTGWGEVLKNDGWFPEGEIQWKIISTL
jgi:hypothetical protein